MLEWIKYRAKIKARAGEFSKLAPEPMKGYLALTASGEKAVHLDGRVRELISLAVAVTTRCDGCIAVHVEAAIKHGVSREEIAEAMGVAIAMNAGASLVYSTRVLDCYAEMTES